MRLIPRLALALALTGLAWLLPAQARAEADRVRIVQPYGLVYLPSYVAVDLKLIEKHARAVGLGEIKVTLTNMASGPAGNDLLLAGDADIGMGGFGPGFTLWDKTRGAQKVKGMLPLCGTPTFLVSTDPRIRSIRDFGEKDRIAISAIRTTAQALAIQMASVKEWGWDGRFRLDPNMVAMSNPDATAALLGGLSEVRSTITIIPFANMLLESGKAHLVMTSSDHIEPGATTAISWTGARFHDGSPKLYAATVAAFEEAMEIIARDPARAAAIYLAREPQKSSIEWLVKIITDPKMITFSATPRGIKQNVDFMVKLGTLKNQPDSWKDLFWDNVWTKDGS